RRAAGIGHFVLWRFCAANAMLAVRTEISPARARPMSSTTHAHPESAPRTMERDARGLTVDRARVAPGEIAVGVVIGRASEYFDFFVYGIASVLVFPAVFFPFENRLEGTLYAFALFALAFIARPLG